MNFKSLLAGAALAALVSAAVGAPANAAVFTNGVVSVGVNEFGQLLHSDDNGLTGVGFQSGGVDVLFAGAPVDSWAVNGAYAYEISGSSFDVVPSAPGTSFGADSAVVTAFTSEFKVVQSFSFAADNVLAIDISLTNITGGALDAVFQRLAEFNIDPDGLEFQTNPFSTGLETTITGFDDPSALNPWNFPCCSADPFDGGAGLRLNLGSLAAGQTRSFTWYYGLGTSGVAGQLNGLGATDVMMVANRDGSFAAAMGVAAPGGAVPEPAAWALMITGFGLAGATLRRRRAILV